MLSWVEHEKSSIALGPDQLASEKPADQDIQFSTLLKNTYL